MLSATKNKKFIKIAACLFMLSAVFLLANYTLAAVDVGLEYAAQTGLGGEDIRIIIARIIRIIIGFLGIIAVGLIIYAGWLWMSSEGNEEKITKAKQVLKNAIIGLIIILSAFAIATFVLNKLIGATSSGPETGGGPGNGGGGIAALGSGIIESHYPGRNQKDVPRNTKIVITFKEPMDTSTLIINNLINSNNIKIYKSVDGVTGPTVSDVQASKSADNKIFVFKPKQYLGSSAEKIWYSVALSKNIKKANGDAAFAGVIGEIAYDWSFEVGTYVDITPPKVASIIPQPGATEPRNVVVQINFSEAVDPLAASGATKNGFNNIIVSNQSDNVAVAGNFYLSNQYQTVEFLTEEACGTNSCGETVYCLPGSKDITTLAKAATLAVIGEPSANFPYDGLVDMADNSLDGNKNGIAQGPQAQSNLPPYDENAPDPETQGDDYSWTFKTNNTIDITSPVINSIKPNLSDSGVSLTVEIEATFNKLLMSNSLNSSSINLISNPFKAINYWISKSDNVVDKNTTVKLNHDQFNENISYSPQINSAVRDIYQNCYSPCSGLGVIGTPSCCNGVPMTGSSCP